MSLSKTRTDYTRNFDPVQWCTSSLCVKHYIGPFEKGTVCHGGFSMGGALALHMAYKFIPDLGGAFALSSFLNHNSMVYKSEKLPDVPLYMCHGDADTLVPLKWGLETFQTLKQKGVNGDFIPLKNTLHELKKGEILGLLDWINNILSPLKS